MSYKTLYSKFLNNLLSIELEETYMILNESIIPNIKTIMKLLLRIEFTEESYHLFYGNVKNTIESFFLYWKQVMAKNITIANRHINLTGSTRSHISEIFLHLLEKTIKIRASLQNDFEKDFSEIDYQFDSRHLENEFHNHILKIQEKNKQLKTLNYQELRDFINTNISLAIISEHKIFEFACHQFASFLTDNHKKIFVSLEENIKRVSRNLQSSTQLQSQVDKWENTFAVSNIEGCKIIKDVSTNKIPVESNVIEELENWQGKLREFLHIKNNLDKLRKVKDKLKQQHSPGALNENVTPETSVKLEKLNKLEIEISNSMITFFCVEGANRLHHSDAIGSFFTDEYGHRVYTLNNGLNRLHTFGDFFVEVHEDARPSYDENGMYNIEHNRKIYKVAPCCSAYMIDEWGVFIKTAPSYQDQCKEEIKKSHYDSRKALEEVFSKLKVILDKKAATYLWNSLSDILTKSLLDIAKRQPENPIHSLAHTLLYYKYTKAKESPELTGRLVSKAETVFKLTKTPQVKRHKKVKDENQEISAFNSNVAQRFLFNLLEQ